MELGMESLFEKYKKAIDEPGTEKDKVDRLFFELEVRIGKINAHIPKEVYQEIMDCRIVLTKIFNTFP